VTHRARPAWQEEIARSRVFVCLLSPAWLRDPALWDHLAYARQLGKPVRVAVTLGAAVPDGLLDGITDLEVRVCATQEEVVQFVLESFPHAGT
jgi:hypothetical protein